MNANDRKSSDIQYKLCVQQDELKISSRQWLDYFMLAFVIVSSLFILLWSAIVFELLPHSAHHVISLIFYPSNSKMNANDSDTKLMFLLKPNQEIQYLESGNDFKVVCYYALPLNASTNQLMPEGLDPYLCTHINIAFAQVVNSTLQPLCQYDLGTFRKVLSLKKSNPRLKVLLSVESFSCEGEFGKMVSSRQTRKKFVKQSIKFLKEHEFDGIDLDWEFPAWPDGDSGQKENFTLLVRELRAASNLLQLSNKFIISLAVAAPEIIITVAYDIPEIAKYVDYVNIMAYDYHFYTTYSPITGPNAPLFHHTAESSYLSTLNTNWSVSHWKTKGMLRKKIMVGIPTYGHSFTLLNEANTGWQAPATGVGATGLDGFVSFSEVCSFLSQGATQVYDSEYKVPYAFKALEWISFDNVESISLKAQYVKQENYGGVMLYALNDDDYLNKCGFGSFPLITKAKSLIFG